MTKRKLMLVALSLCMVAILAIGGSLAYFTDTEDVTNIFTVGDVTITLDEAQVKKDGDKWVPDTDAGRTEDGNRYENVYPGAVLPKDPTVHNVGTNDAYVRVQVTIDCGTVILPSYVKNSNDYKNAFLAFVDNSLGAKWEITGMSDPWEQIGNSDTSFSFVITYKERLTAGASTSPVFERIKVFEGWDNEDVASMLPNGVGISIVAEAIQAEGFETMDAAWAAFDEQSANN